jgi:hypothetical protein
MPDYRTKIGHPQIIISLDDNSEINPDWLLGYFEQSVKAGAHFDADATIQIGWMLTILKRNQSDDLELWEPDFDGIPIRWIRGANNTVRHLVLQKSIADLAGCELESPSLRQAGIVTQSFSDDPAEFVMTREISGGDSGWAFRRDGEEILKTTPCEFKSLYEISLICTNIIPFLGLPSGSNVRRTKRETTLDLAGKIISSTQNDLLKRITEAAILI